MYKCPHCNSILPAHTATCPSMVIAKLEAELADSVTLAFDQQAEICSMNDAGHKLIDENERCVKRITEWEELICKHMNDKDDLKAENERLREESKIDQLIIKDLLEAENERLQGGTRGASSRWQEIEKLREENKRLSDRLNISQDQDTGIYHDEIDVLQSALNVSQAENNRLRKDLASWRKGECRRRIDRAMEGK